MGKSAGAVLSSSLFVVFIVPLQPYRSPRERPQVLSLAIKGPAGRDTVSFDHLVSAHHD
jgi:hypothetical protein